MLLASPGRLFFSGKEYTKSILLNQENIMPECRFVAIVYLLGVKEVMGLRQRLLKINFAKFTNGGGGGIRTPGASRHSGFQDRRDRPLCHPSRLNRSNNNG